MKILHDIVHEDRKSEKISAFGGRVFYRRPIYDNGTSNVHKSPLTTELTTLGSIFGIRRQNYQTQTLVEKQIFFGQFWISPQVQFKRKPTSSLHPLSPII